MKIVKENIQFQREVGTKSSLGLGKFKDPRLKTFDQLAKKYGFKEITVPKPLENKYGHFLDYKAIYRHPNGKTLEVYWNKDVWKDPYFLDVFDDYQEKEYSIFSWIPQDPPSGFKHSKDYDYLDLWEEISKE